MGLTEEMIAANVRNWLADLAIGAKAVSKTLSLGKEPEWKYNVSCYADVNIDNVITVAVHNIKEVAEVSGLELKHRDFVEGDYYYQSFSGEDFIIFNGVKFSDLILNKES